MNILSSLAGGAAGAATVTLLNETVRRAFPAEAPHVEITGMRGIERVAEAAGTASPRGDALFQTALVGDIVGNSLYFALAGIGKPEGALVRGTLLGAAAGIGAVALPPRMGLGSRPTARTPLTAALTVAWYLAGGIAAGAVIQRLGGESKA